MVFGHSTYSGFETAGGKKLGEAYGEQTVSKHKANTDGSRYPRSVLKFAQDRTGHPTKKPVDLMQWIIRTYSNPGDIVLDNTMGEGSTGVACALEGRKFIGIELDAGYFNRAVADITPLITKGKKT